MQWPTLSALTALAIGLASRAQEQAGYTGAERKCTARRYYDYNAKQLSVDVCKACLNGTVVTCNTASSRARGLSDGSWLSFR
jgi:hypothetical protein